MFQTQVKCQLAAKGSAGKFVALEGSPTDPYNVIEIRKIKYSGKMCLIKGVLKQELSEGQQ